MFQIFFFSRTEVQARTQTGPDLMGLSILNLFNMFPPFKRQRKV